MKPLHAIQIVKRRPSLPVFANWYRSIAVIRISARRILNFLFYGGLVVGLTNGPNPPMVLGVSPPPAPTKQDEKATPPIESLGQALAEIIHPTLTNDQLDFEFPQMAEVNDVLNRQAKYFRGGGSGQSGGRFWYSMRNGPPLRFEIGSGNRNPFIQDESNRFFYDIELSESHDRWTSFFYQQGATRIQVVDIAQQRLLQFMTNSDKQTVIRWVDGATGGVIVGKSLIDASMRHGDSIQQHVVPLLEQTGIRLPTMIIKSELFDLALACLQFDETQQARIQPLIDSLNAASFAERESATQELLTQFPTWRIGIVVALLNEQIVGEVRSRLRKVLDESQSDPAGKSALNFLNQNCWRDAAFWLELGEQTEDPTLRAKIAQHLETITQLKFVADWDAAKLQLAAQQPSSAPVTPVTNDASQSPRILEKVRPTVADLFSLIVADNRLTLDRAFWRERFGNREIAEIIADAETLIKQSHLPPRWLNLGNGYQIDLMDHPHLLFEHLESALMNQMDAQQQMMLFPRQQNVMRNERDRRFEINDVKGALLYLKNQGDLPAEHKQTLQIRLDEQHPLGVQIAVDQQQSGRFYLLLVDPHTNRQLVVFQNESGSITLHWFHQDQHRVLQAENFAALLAAEKSWLAETIWPFLVEHNLRLSTTLTGTDAPPGD